MMKEMLGSAAMAAGSRRRCFAEPGGAGERRRNLELPVACRIHWRVGGPSATGHRELRELADHIGAGGI